MANNTSKTGLEILASEVMLKRCIKSYVFMSGFDSATTEQFVQDVLVAFWKNEIYRAKPLTELRRLFATSIRNLFKKHRTDQYRDQSIDDPVELNNTDSDKLEPQVIDETALVSEQVAARLTVEKIYSGATRPQRDVIMRLLLGESHAEAAQFLGKRRSTVSVQVSQIRQKFSKLSW